MGRLMYCCNERRFESPDLHFTFYFMEVWVVWAFRGSPVGGVTGRSDDLDSVGRYRGTRDSEEKGDGRYIWETRVRDTHLGYTGLTGGLKHLKIETNLIDERFASMMGECVI
jgi:hypothetical protein